MKKSRCESDLTDVTEYPFDSASDPNKPSLDELVATVESIISKTSHWNELVFKYGKQEATRFLKFMVATTAMRLLDRNKRI